MNLASPSNPVESRWKSVWKVDVLPNVCFNLWKVCTNSLPTRVNLNKIFVLESFICPLCHLEP